MISKWFEVGRQDFIEIFDTYWQCTHGAQDKVLEIQNLGPLSEGNHDFRLFLGAGIKFSDYREYSKEAFSIIRAFSRLTGTDPDLASDLFELPSTLGYCMTEAGAPRVIPIGIRDGNLTMEYNILRDGLFGIFPETPERKSKMQRNLSGWYIKSPDGKYIVDSVQGTYIRIRTMSLADWKGMISEFLSFNKFFDYVTSNDIEPKQIIWKNK